MVDLQIKIAICIILTVATSSNCKNTLKKTIQSNNCSQDKSQEIFQRNNDSVASKIIAKLKNITDSDIEIKSNKHNEQVNHIIASINRIKMNITSNKEDIIDAIILKTKMKNVTQIKNIPNKKQRSTTKKPDTNTTEKETYVEILTVEPNNTSKSNKSSNIFEMLKQVMPLFRNTMRGQHNFTIIEKKGAKNHTFTAVKNLSTIVVTFCEHDNTTIVNNTNNIINETYIKFPINESEKRVFTDDSDKLSQRQKVAFNEAADYGIRKMQELYNVTEPKLYSMGFWLDNNSPARYVAAFNAPADDEVEQYARYGYASLQAAVKLKELSLSQDELEGRTEDLQVPDIGALRQSSLMKHCPIRGVPRCPPASKRYRTHDGTCNNFRHPRWGSTKTPVERFLPASYSDNLQAPRRSVHGQPLPSAREISTTIHEDRNIETLTVTHLLMQWGQFLDHDIVSTSQARGFKGSVPRCCKDGGRDFVPKEFMHPECMPISVPSNDPFYGSRGIRCLDFVRSSPAPRDDCSLGWREQLNQVSAYIDGSPLYGSSAKKSDGLRLFRGGLLQYGKVQQRRPVLPPGKNDDLCHGGAVSADCFKSGDGRVNEHPGLVAAHIVWLRQHNRMAQELAHLNSHWSDEKLYQETRKIIGAMIQHITYREFLPVILGPQVTRTFEVELQKKGFYEGYDPESNASPASAFGSAAFRFGHSLVQPSMMRYDRFHRPLNTNVSLHDELSNPSNIWSMGAVDRLFLGMINQPIQKRDEFITKELTNHLFQSSNSNFGIDLAAINIQRGRDHGIPGYTSWREPCGLTPIKDFDGLNKVMAERTVKRLSFLYRHVEDIDLFTGGMAEKPVVGGLVGPTFACIIAQQFAYLRKGDRFWYENGGFESSFTPAQLQQIRRISIAQVLCRNLDSINNIQPFAFLSPSSPQNRRQSCNSDALENFDLTPWIEVNSDFGKSDSNNEINNVTSTTTTTEKFDLKKLLKEKVNPIIALINKFKTKDHLTNHNIDTINMTLTEAMKAKIDDKLDFQNKTRRIDDTDYDEFNLEDEVNSKLNNDYYDDDSLPSEHATKPKRPINQRPVITVTENIDKYTYLINYVPKNTQSWRQTTRKPDVVKITYQNYDDTYRRPYNPYYYNKHDDMTKNDFDYRRDLTYKRPTKRQTTKQTTQKKDDFDKTTEDGRLVTFRYIGTYDNGRQKDRDVTSINDDDESLLGKELNPDKPIADNMKFSTFFRIETVTIPYTSTRPTRQQNYITRRISSIKPAVTTSSTPKTIKIDNDKILKENYNNPGNPNVDLEDRSGGDTDLNDDSRAAAKTKVKLKTKKPTGTIGKTPSVDFHVLPSENSPSLWAVYEENAELGDGLPDVPAAQHDPHPLMEVPKPLTHRPRL